MHKIRKRLTYANVMSSIAVFLVLGGATAFAASHLGKNSVGAKQLKKNAVTAAKIKGNTVTTAKLKDNAVTTTKIQNGAITGAKVNLGSLGAVPTATNSATTDVIKTSNGIFFAPQEVTVLERGPLKVMLRCFNLPNTNLAEQAFILSSTDGSVFSSWEDGSSKLGPTTPETERELSGSTWVDSTGPFAFEGPSEVNFSATAANGQGFNGFIGMATEKNSNTCWYWVNATILG